MVAAGAMLVAFMVDRHPFTLLPWAPWHFSWLSFLGIGCGLLWFCRGLYRTRPEARPGVLRCCSFLAGLGLLYGVLLSEFEYFSQHMFFLNRVQHAVLHHLAPFLIALGGPGETIQRGMPTRLRLWAASNVVRGVIRTARQPVIAVVLFEGVLFLWLVPPVAYRAMLNWPLYEIMNASMVVDGLLFWCLVLDPRPNPPAPVSFFARLTLSFVIIFPQIGLGTAIGMARYDLYPAFALCGRVFSSIGPLQDQQIGGLIIWVPTGMMSAIAALIVMRRMFLDEDARGAMPQLKRFR
jgi:putative membrane protein